MSQITAGRKIAKRGKFKAKALICDSSACNHGAPRTPPHGVRGSSPIAGADPTTSYLDVIPEAKGKKYSAKNCNYTYLNLLILGLQILALAGKLQGNSGGVRSHSPMSFSPRGQLHVGSHVESPLGLSNVIFTLHSDWPIQEDLALLKLVITFCIAEFPTICNCTCYLTLVTSTVPILQCNFLLQIKISRWRVSLDMRWVT